MDVRTPEPATPQAPLRAALRLLLPSTFVLLLWLLLALALALGARWLLYTEAGAQWLLPRLPPLDVQGWRGALLGTQWRADRLRLRWGSGGQQLLIEGLRAEGLSWHWRPNAHAWLGVDARSLQARRVALDTASAAAAPAPMPASIALPLQLGVAQVQVDELRVDKLEAITGVEVQGLSLSAAPDGEHRVERFAAHAYGIDLAASARIATASPLALEARATLRPIGAAPRWAAELHAGGSVAQLALGGTLRGVPRAGREAPSAQLSAELHPLRAWPLAALQLQTRSLDLAALSAQAPQTSLSGTASVSGGGGRPLALAVQIDNASPGRWNEGRLPLRQIAVQAQGDIGRPDRIELKRFEIMLADATRSAGRVNGQGLWLGHDLRLETQWSEFAPQRVDGRAAAMTLSGPVAATLRGLPAPDMQAAAAPGLQADAKLDLQGRFDAAPQPLRLQLEGSADAAHVELRHAIASSAGASAELSAKLARGAGAAWQLQTRGQLRGFDPALWWPGEAGSAWRKGGHRLEGEWQLDLSLPAEAAKLPPLTLAQRVAGNGRIDVHDSLLAGVPLRAAVKLAYASGAGAASLHVELNAAGNTLVADGQANPAGSGEGDRLHVEVQADALPALAPLVRLFPALAIWAPQHGSASATLTIAGRWPALSTDGQVQLAQLQAGSLALSRGSASWQLALRANAPLALQLDLAGVQWGTRRAEHVRAELRGTPADHHIDVSGALPLVPPAPAAQLLGIDVQSGTRAQLQAQGSWQGRTGGGGRWRAHVERLVVGSWDGSSTDAPPASGWIDARDLNGEIDFDAAGDIVAAQADPGRIGLAGALAMRWDAVRYARADPPRLTLNADIEAFELAPLLARWQPGVGWQGDLKLAARVDIQAAEKFDANVVIERRSGDLSVASGEGRLALGLDEFQLVLAAHDGLWTFVPKFSGRSLGEIGGLLQARTSAARRWPDADAPIQGQLQAHVADIGIWGTWVPPGWRLTGELRTTAGIGGRFGAPEYTGELTGSGLGVRNLLQGVHVTDGQVAVQLEGEKAEVERFTLQGGEGTVTVSGGATLGRDPHATLRLQAEHFRIVGRVDRQLIVSGSAELALQAERSRLDGHFTVDEGLFDLSASDAPALDDDVTVRRPGQPTPAAAAAAAPRTVRDFTLAVDIDLGQHLRVRGRGLDSEVRGALRVSAPAGRLAFDGTIRTAGGTYAAYGQKLDIERGILAFSGVADNPRLDVLALRPNIDMRVGVQITGNLQTPRVRLYSEPDMSDTDKLSWLVLGRAPDGLGRSDVALLQRAAVALLSGEGEAPTDAVLKALGIDDLSLRQSDSDVRETVVAIGKQLTRRWYLGYERGVNATTGTWQLTYRIAQRFTLRAQSGLDNSLDLIWTWRLQPPPAADATRKVTVVPR